MLQSYTAKFAAIGAAAATTPVFGAGIVADSIDVYNDAQTVPVRVTIVAAGTAGQLEFVVRAGQSKSIGFDGRDLITAVTVTPVTDATAPGAVAALVNATSYPALVATGEAFSVDITLVEK